MVGVADDVGVAVDVDEAVDVDAVSVVAVAVQVSFWQKSPFSYRHNKLENALFLYESSILLNFYNFIYCKSDGCKP